MAGKKRGPKPKKLISKQASLENKVNRFSLNDSYVSLLLGLFVVILVSVSLIVFVKNKNPQHSPPQISSQKTQEPPQEQKAANPTMTTAYTVVEGDDLKSISLKFYGTEDNYEMIVKANNLQNPDVIEVGRVLKIPNVNIKNVAVYDQPEEPIGNKITGKNYAVGNNESLWDIALRSYGDGYRWVDIAKANNLPNPDVLVEGTILQIPR